MSGEEESSLEVEIEALKAIYIHELDVTCDDRMQSKCLKISLHPATADNAEEQYVRMDLVLDIPLEYPDVLPTVTIRNPRGLSDEKIEKIQLDVRETAHENKGSPMLYQLIEVAKDHLTQENVPCCQCTICLYGFAEGDVFTKTQCYHYFHSHCLSRYVRHALLLAEEEEEPKLSSPQGTAPLEDNDDGKPSTKVVCPVCRLPMALSELAEGEYPPPVEQTRQPDFSLTPALERLQRDMAQLFHRQQSQGGIINVDAEKNKFLLEISVAPEGSGRSSIAKMPKRFGGPFKFRTMGLPMKSVAAQHLPADDDKKVVSPNSATCLPSSEGFAEASFVRHSRRGEVSHSPTSGSDGTSGSDRPRRTDGRQRRDRPHFGRGRAQPRYGDQATQRLDFKQEPSRGPVAYGTGSLVSESDAAFECSSLEDGSSLSISHSSQKRGEASGVGFVTDRRLDASPRSTSERFEEDGPRRHRGSYRGFRRSRRGFAGPPHNFAKKQMDAALPAQGFRNHASSKICSNAESR